MFLLTMPLRFDPVSPGRACLGALFAAVVGLATLPEPGGEASTDPELSRLAAALAERHGFSGVLLVARGDDVLVEQAFGWADREREVRNETDTRFLVASLTKPVVAFLTLRLVETGALALEDAAEMHVPELQGTDAGRATVRELLTHTSGLPHYEGWPGFLEQQERAHTDAELLERFAATAAVAEPGTQHRYSGPGYLLLGTVLERAGEAPLPELLERLVLIPLGMRSTRLLGASETNALHARPYVRGVDDPRPARVRHPSTLRATGGLVTTARDLHRFARAIQRGELLGPENRATLLRPALRNYACGLIVYRHPWTGVRFARHMGNMDGVAAHFVFGLEDERVCIALANVAPTPVDDIDDALMARTPATDPGDKDAGGEDAGSDGGR